MAPQITMVLALVAWGAIAFIFAVRELYGTPWALIVGGACCWVLAAVYARLTLPRRGL